MGKMLEMGKMLSVSNKMDNLKDYRNIKIKSNYKDNKLADWNNNTHKPSKKLLGM